MTEQEKLAELDKELDITNRHVSWGIEGQKMNAEEKSAFLYKVMKQIQEDQSNTVPVPVSILSNIADALFALESLSKFSIEELTSLPKEILDLKAKIRNIVGMNPVIAEQCLPHDLRVERRVERQKRDK